MTLADTVDVNRVVEGGDRHVKLDSEIHRERRADVIPILLDTVVSNGANPIPDIVMTEFPSLAEFRRDPDTIGA